MNRIRSEWVLFKIKIMLISTVVDINKIYLVYQCENSRFSVSFSSQNYSYFFILGFHICTRNGEESLKIVTPAQCFENYHLDTSSIEEGMY